MVLIMLLEVQSVIDLDKAHIITVSHICGINKGVDHCVLIFAALQTS